MNLINSLIASETRECLGSSITRLRWSGSWSSSLHQKSEYFLNRSYSQQRGYIDDWGGVQHHRGGGVVGYSSAGSTALHVQRAAILADWLAL